MQNHHYKITSEPGEPAFDSCFFTKHGWQNGGPPTWIIEIEINPFTVVEIKAPTVTKDSSTDTRIPYGIVDCLESKSGRPGCKP